MKEEENHKDVAKDEEVKVKEEARSSRMKEEECEKSNESNSGTTTLPPPQQHRKTEVDQQEERIMKTEARRMKEGEECVTVKFKKHQQQKEKNVKKLITRA